MGLAVKFLTANGLPFFAGNSRLYTMSANVQHGCAGLSLGRAAFPAGALCLLTVTLSRLPATQSQRMESRVTVRAGLFSVWLPYLVDAGVMLMRIN